MQRVLESIAVLSRLCIGMQNCIWSAPERFCSAVARKKVGIKVENNVFSHEPTICMYVAPWSISRATPFPTSP